MKIKVLYEDKDILVIDKPTGISVHPDGRSKPACAGREKTPNQSKLGTGQAITDWVLKNYPEMKDVGEPMILGDEEIKRPGIVHRLDKETSGVLLLAKNQKAHEFLKNQFKNREIKKTYHAIVSGFIKNNRGVINKPIGRSPSDFRRHLAGRGARGELREAITEYKVLKRFTSPQPSPYKGEGEEKFTYLEIRPKTGRTHQIRVHMKFLNYPVACDSLYNPKGFCPEGLDRLALHAKSIEFKNLDGKILKIESPLPKDFKKFIL